MELNELAYLRHIEALNAPITESFLPWTIAGEVVGWVRARVAKRLLDWSAVFELSADQLTMRAELTDFAERSAALAEIVAQLAAAGEFATALGEPYPVTPGARDEALCVVDRVAASWFGVRAFGQHLNGFVHKPDGMHMWIGRRAADRLLFPGALDQVVAGGLPYGISHADNLVKECAEEAGIPPNLAGLARPVGVVTYNRVTNRGFRPDVLYCYDIELPEDFKPVNTDGEVEEFLLLPIDEVMEIVRDTDDFKLNCNLVIIDFLVRHGRLGPERSDYLQLLHGLRPPLGVPTQRGNPSRP